MIRVAASFCFCWSDFSFFAGKYKHLNPPWKRAPVAVVSSGCTTSYKQSCVVTNLGFAALCVWIQRRICRWSLRRNGSTWISWSQRSWSGWETCLHPEGKEPRRLGDISYNKSRAKRSSQSLQLKSCILVRFSGFKICEPAHAVVSLIGHASSVWLCGGLDSTHWGSAHPLRPASSWRGAWGQ